MSIQTAGVILLATVPLLACQGESTTPPLEMLSSARRAHGLELDLSIDPTATVPGGAFTATLTVTNHRREATTLTSGCTAFARGVVYRAGEEQQQLFIGTGDGCFTALSTYRLDIGESFKQVWQLTASNRIYLGGMQWEIVPAPEGEYVFRASPDVITIDQESARLPELQARFRVK